MSAREPADVRGRHAWMMVGGLLLVGTILGVVAFANYRHSESLITGKYAEYEKRGAELSASACVSDVIGWFEKDCDAIPELCLKAVEEAVERCLAATDRRGECESMRNVFPSSRWAFEQCRDNHALDKKSKKVLTKSCTAAYRQLDNFCKRTLAGVVKE